MKTNQTIDEKTALEQFRNFDNKLREQVLGWMRKRPAQRSAIILISDRRAGEWSLHPLEYQTGKKPNHLMLRALFDVLLDNDEVYQKAVNLMRCVTKQRHRDAKRAEKEKQQSENV